LQKSNSSRFLFFLLVLIISYSLLRHGKDFLTSIAGASAGRDLLLAWLLPILVFLVLSWSAVAQRLKSLILSMLPKEQKFVPTSIEAFGGLDRQEIERYTDEIKGLGFSHLLDYTIEANYTTKMVGFARLFGHESQYCFAEINQVIPEGVPATPVRMVIVSRFNDGWSLSSTDRKADAITTLIGRRPKNLWVSRPGQNTDVIYREHLELRNRITRDIGVQSIRKTGQEYYFNFLLEGAEQQRETIQKMLMPFELAGLFVFMLFPITEWMGMYGKRGRGK
jgi:hypothetical protein